MRFVQMKLRASSLGYTPKRSAIVITVGDSSFVNVPLAFSVITVVVGNVPFNTPHTCWQTREHTVSQARLHGGVVARAAGARQTSQESVRASEAHRQARKAKSTALARRGGGGVGLTQP